MELWVGEEDPDRANGVGEKKQYLDRAGGEKSGHQGQTGETWEGKTGGKKVRWWEKWMLRETVKRGQRRQQGDGCVASLILSNLYSRFSVSPMLCK